MDLKSLNPEQREAVRHRGSPLLVLAGAGSGKTRVITMRIAHLLAEGDAVPEDILAVTFTNRAAAEMKERVGELVGSAAGKKLTVSTFHAFCAQLLRQESAALGFTPHFTIYDASDQRTLLGRCFAEFSTGKEKFDLGNFAYRISRSKNNGLTPDSYLPFREDKYDEMVPALWKSYQEALRTRDAMDFDDLLCLSHLLLADHPDVLERVRSRHRHVLIDEYQDTNRLQFEIARKIADRHRNLCVVGDDDQSIYGWRGAEVANILEFSRHFPDARVVTLDRNYRSTSTILDAANSVISRNNLRHEKTLKAEAGQGRVIDLVTAEDEIDEAGCVSARIREMAARFNLQWSDFAVLYRSNIQSRPFEMAFRNARIPYVVIGGMEFFDRKEVKDIGAYLRVVANPRDDVSLRRILNVPRRGIGDTTLDRLNQTSRAVSRPLLDVLRSPGFAPPDTARAGIQDFLHLLDSSRATLKQKGLSQAVLHLIHQSGYLDELEKTSPSPAAFEARKEIALDVANVADSFERNTENPTLWGFLESLSLGDDFKREAKSKRFESDTTRLMTLHSAKGLEFPIVFLVGLEEGLLPHSRAMTLDTDVAEERRLFYVGMTRARKHLIITTASLRSIRGRPKQSVESRFLEEIPSHLIRYQMSGDKLVNEAEPALIP